MKNPTFVEYENDIYLVVGIGTDRYSNQYFQVVPLRNHSRISRAFIEINSINVLMTEVIEITDPNKLSSIRLLYG